MRFVKKPLVLSVLSMLVIASGCARTTKTKICYNFYSNYNLPEIPMPGAKQFDELDVFCLPDTGQCKNVNKWLNDLYIFKAEYDIHRANLKYKEDI